MKKSKIFIPFITLTGITSTIAPLVTLTGCGKLVNGNGNLMKEFNPTLSKLAESEVGNWSKPSDAIIKFIDEVNRNPQFFVQDLLYTMSRGLKVYNEVLQKNGVKIKHNNFDISLSNIVGSWTASEPKVTFDLTATISYDYSDTPKEIMETMGLYNYKFSAKPSFHVVFDFNTDKFTGQIGQNVNGKRRQLTFISGIAHIGISECNSTIQVYQDSGSAINLDGKKVSVSVSNAEAKRGFINPSKQYWENVAGDLETYNQRLNDIEQLKRDGYYPLFAILDQYLGNDPYIATNTPNSMDFGSYHMGTGSLTGTFEYSKQTDYKETCFGLNFCNGPEINYPRFSKESCYDVENQILTLPTYKNPDPFSPTDPITKLAAQAFDNTQSNAYDIGIPTAIQKIIIPEEYVEIGARAITSNASFGESQLTNITFERNLDALNPCKLGVGAFYNLPKVSMIDLRTLKIDDYLRFETNWKNAFKGIHPETSEKIVEGQIWIPNLSGLPDPQHDLALKNWKNSINNHFGIHCFLNTDEQAEKYGWEIKE